ncbi:MAG: membrane protein insertase YidC [Bacilli bacterium]|nr:membrane protein insertase YidC [Bacilli bacterium]
MNKRTKVKLLGALGLAAGALMLSGCVSNFCSDIEKARIAYPYEQGVTVYVDGESAVPQEYRTPELSFQPLKDKGNDELWAYIPVNENGYYAARKAEYLTNNIIASAVSNNVSVPSYDYFKKMDQKLLEAAISAAKADGITVDEASITAAKINPFSVADCVGNEEGVTVTEDSILRNYGYLKFVTKSFNAENGTTTFKFDYGNWDKWTEEIQKEIETAKPGSGAASVPNADFVSIYKGAFNSLTNGIRTCITTREGNYGHYGASNNWQVKMDSISWGEAWQHGFLEGLIVYPVACLVDALNYSFDPSLSGVGQIWALVLTTIIVRLLVVLLTFKSTLDQQKMTALQPQIAKIQAKYPNSNTNQAEQARVSQETMALYRRNKVNPLSSILAIIIQFPVFVSVWGALQGSAALSSGEVLNLRLSDSIWSVLSNFSGTWYANTTGWWTAGILFILMAATQFCAMKLPQWINAARNKKLSKTSANPAADKTARTQKMVSWFMLIFTIVLGISLPAAMGVYWAIGGLVAMAQTAIIQGIMRRKKDR